MAARSLPDKFLVAFSFAGEQRELVRAVVEAVERELGSPNVFFDEWFEHYLAGGDADLKLHQIYGERCVLAVVCVSERYGGKPWTKAEHAAIRARYMKSHPSGDDPLSILPIRVGDGEVEGILFNTIVPDIRSRTPVAAAELIISRLRLIAPAIGASNPVLDEWPDSSVQLCWPVANHQAARIAFEHLLTRTAAYRVLPIRGPSEVGKTQISMQMLGDALRISKLACGRFDFKGVIDMDSELRSFVNQLDVSLPPSTLRLNERLSHILDALRRRSRPALLIFDTYEAAGEERDWMEKQLLPSVIRAEWLRVVLVGQRVPNPAGAIWERVSAPVITLQAPPAEDWFHFSKQHKSDITIEFVRQAHQYCRGKPSVLAELLGPPR